MTRMKKMMRKKGWMPRWHFPWRDGAICKWKKWQEWKNDEKNKSEYLDDTPPEKMEEYVSNKKMTGVKTMMREKRLNA